MPEYMDPGVYVEEIERGARPIEGVATSTAAFLGETERGPTQPELVDAYNEYQRLFGGPFDPSKFMPQAVAGFFDNGGQRVYVCRIVGNNATAASHDFVDLHVEASGPGDWGKRVSVQIADSTTKRPDSADSPKPVGIRVMVAYWSWLPRNFAPFNPVLDNATLPRPAWAEDFDDIVLDDENSPDYYDKRVNGNSTLITLKLTTAPGAQPNVPRASSMLDQGGVAGDPPQLGNYQGGDPAPSNRTGLAALLLDAYRDVALVYAPGQVAKDIRQALITHCEDQKFRFAVLDCAPDKGNISDADLDPRTSIKDTSYAAYYYPWIYISDPKTGARKKIPPGGHVLGIFARSDTERGVFKAPANEPVRGVLDLEFSINEGTQDELNPKGVNVIRSFPERGILLWGARTLSSNTLWKYVSVRRLFIFLERSIYEGTQWVVFEPNDERLWARVKDTIRRFLRTQWRAGAMMGTTEDEAFFVTCDRTTMTQDDILNGRLVCEIGIAPVRPAEFVIFRIFQRTAEAQS
jgi:Bacteriophage tail sheath protein